jgi:predicted GNAT family N-acyltransferase/CTP:molybdopterin cytidylyltransferase MocA
MGMPKALLVRTDGMSQIHAWLQVMAPHTTTTFVTVPDDDIVAVRIQRDAPVAAASNTHASRTTFVRNNEPGQGYWGSIASVLPHVTNDWVVIAPVDASPNADVLRALTSAAETHAHNIDAVVPMTLSGAHGHPVVVRREALLTYGAQGARGGLRAALQDMRVRHERVDAPNILHNHDEPMLPVNVMSVASAHHQQGCLLVRRRVFIEEQDVPEDLEIDGHDEDCLHVMAHAGEWLVGTARVSRVGDAVAKVQRVAVLLPWRKHGVGAKLMSAIEARARSELSCTSATLGAQLSAVPFYERLGYVAEGEVFLDAGIPHRTMTKPLRVVA